MAFLCIEEGSRQGDTAHADAHGDRRQRQQQRGTGQEMVQGEEGSCAKYALVAQRDKGCSFLHLVMTLSVEVLCSLDRSHTLRVPEDIIWVDLCFDALQSSQVVSPVQLLCCLPI